jgi:hypothetical protein
MLGNFVEKGAGGLLEPILVREQVMAEGSAEVDRKPFFIILAYRLANDETEFILSQRRYPPFAKGVFQANLWECGEMCKNPDTRLAAWLKAVEMTHELDVSRRLIWWDDLPDDWKQDEVQAKQSRLHVHAVRSTFLDEMSKQKNFENETEETEVIDESG